MPDISTIKASDGDYTTLAAWETAKDGLSPDDYIAECDSGFDLGSVTFSDWPFGSTATVRAATGHENFGDFTAGAYITGGITCIEPNLSVTIQDMRINKGGSGTAIARNGSGYQDSTILINRCIITGGQFGVSLSGSYHAGPKVYIYNSIIQGATDYGVYYDVVVGWATSECRVWNCTIDGDGADYAVYASGENSTGHVISVKNSVGVRNTTDFYVSNSSNINENGGGYNAVEDFTGSIFGSTGSLSSQAYASMFEDVASDDYSLKTGSNLIEAGTDLSATFTTDITGATRSGTWSIGAYAVVLYPEINLVGNGENISNGDTTPSEADYTDFGSVNV